MGLTSDVFPYSDAVSSVARAAQKGQQPRCIWLTGLSGAGKSSLAKTLDFHLHQQGFHTYLLDGDNLRTGLNQDLGFGLPDRAENVRRVGEVAKLMVDAGLIVITALISPIRHEREKVRQLFELGQFIEVYVDTPFNTCEERDPKGLYAKARAGLLQGFTGIDSPYEAPSNPDITVDTSVTRIEDAIKLLLEIIQCK